VSNRQFWWGSIVCALAVAAACSTNSQSPASPSRGAVALESAAPDGSTLKVTAPTPQSPINGAKGNQGEPVTLVIGNSTPTFAGGGIALTYRFEIYNSANTKVYSSALQNSGAGTTTSHVVTVTLEGEKTYTWQARAEYQGAVGPFSGRATFVTPTSEGYIKADEIYDPLANGKTVGTINGPTEWVPGVGIKLLSTSSFVSYQLPQTVVEGEMSAIITNVGVVSSNEDPKLRIMTMREGEASINDNLYRMSVDKRGNGAIAWRFLTGPGKYIETVSGERQVYPFHESLTYFVQATWRAGFFNVIFREGGVNGNEIYNFGKAYDKSYTPLPHNVYIGSPYSAGDRGDASSLTDMVLRQLWVSSRARPDFANK
jgi:hypothetical protein